MTGWREQLRRAELFDRAGRTASGTEDTELPPPLTASWGVDDIAGCGHPGYGDLCATCESFDQKHYDGRGL